ncbi:MAG: NAD(P)-dependent oxidoreductase [Oligoflexia bacterium]|nr:NAD(P)-dependent oxidoreductase [Oligoflexia bacterium]
MRTVVFGGTGFLGSHVADILTDQKHDVVIFDIVKSHYQRSTQQMIVANILDFDAVLDAVAGADYVYHFAGVADIGDASERPIETIKNNILGTINVLEACRINKIKRFIYASTMYVYSKHGSFYRSSKQSVELFIENYQQIYNLNYTVLRYGSLYGRRANWFNFIHKAIRQALTEGRIIREGDGEEIRDYINVIDAAKASVDILREEFSNKYVIISGVQTIKVKDLLRMIKEILSEKIEVQYVDVKSEGSHYQVTPYSFRPKIAIKYLPEYYYDLGQGILDCIHEIYEELEGLKITNDNHIESYFVNELKQNILASTVRE